MTRPIARLLGRSSLIGLIALGGASVTADNAEKLVPDPALVSEPVVQVWGARTRDGALMGVAAPTALAQALFAAVSFSAQSHVGRALARVADPMMRDRDLEAGAAADAVPWLIALGLGIVGLAVLVA